MQQQQGMHMNNLDLEKSSLSNILQQGGGGYSDSGPDGSGMSYPATYGNNDNEGPMEKMPRLDRLSPEQNVASSMDGDDDGDVFLPNKCQDDSGPFRSQDMGGASKSGMDPRAFRNNSSSNPSPDMNEDDKVLAKNTLLQKLLEDIESGHNLGKKRNNNSPTSSTTSKLEGSKSLGLCKDNQQKHDKKSYTQSHKDSTQGDRGGNPGRNITEAQKHSATAAAAKEERLLGNLLDGDCGVLFESGMLPAEQPGFVSSTVVSTTTVLRTKSESDAEKDKDQANKVKQNNVLLMEDGDSSATSPQDSSFLKNDESQNNNNTTNPTVTTTKPKLTSRSGGGNQRNLNDNLMDNDSDEMVQQLLQAANDISDDINQPDVGANFLKEFEQSQNSSDAALMQNILGDDTAAMNSSNDNQFTNNQRDNTMSSGPVASNTNTSTTTGPNMPPNWQNCRGCVDSTNAPARNQAQPPVSSGPHAQGGGNFGSSPMESLGLFSKAPPSAGHPMAQMQQMAPPNQTAPSQGPKPHMPPFQSQSLNTNNPMEEQQLMQQLEQVLTSDNNLLPEIDDALGLNNFYPDGTPMSSSPTPTSSSGMLHSMLNNSSSLPMSSQSIPHMTSISSPMHQGNMGGFPGGGVGGMGMEGQHPQGGGGMMGPQVMGNGGPMMRLGYRPQHQMPYMNPMQQQRNPMQSGMPGQAPGGQNFPPGGPPDNMMQPPQQGGPFNQMKQQHMLQQEWQRHWHMQRQQQRQQQFVRSQSLGAMPGGRPPQLKAAATAAATAVATAARQRRMMHQQQHKNLMMLQQQTCSVQQVEKSQLMNQVNPQDFQEKLSDILNPSQGGAASNVTIQKQPYCMGPQQYQQKNTRQYNQTMPQNRPNFQGTGMPPQGAGAMGPNSMQYQDFGGGNMGSNPMEAGDSGGGGNMMQGGMMGSNMGPHPYMMGGLNMPTTSTMGRNTGINPSIPRPNLMASQSMGGGPHGPGHGHTPGQLTCSMSMPVGSGGMGPRNSMSPNQFPMQGNASGGQYLGQGGGTPNQMMTRMLNSSMPQNTSMTQSNAMPVGSGGMGPGNSMSPNQFPMQGNASGGQYLGQGGGTPNQMMTRMLNSSMPQNTSMTQSNAMPVGSGGMGPGNSMSPNQFPMQGNASGGQYPGQGGGTPNQMMTRMLNSSMPQNTSMTQSNAMPVGSGGMGPGNSMSPNQFPMQGNASGGQYPGQGGGTPNQMLNSSMPQNTSMTQSNAMGNRWGNNAPPSTAGQSSQQMYPTPVTTQAPSMGQDMFTGGGNGGMNRRNIYFQGMMGQQQRGPGNQNAPVTSQQNQDNQDPDGKGTTLLQKLLFE